MGDELHTVWEDWSNGTTRPTARIRERIYWDAPVVTEFCIQLEYSKNSYLKYPSPGWTQVARFDHNVSPDRGHDIRQEGLHLDVYGKNGKEYVESNFPRVELRQAPAWCRTYLEKKHAEYLKEFEQRINVPEIVKYYDS